MPFQNYSLAAGFNNAAGLQNIETTFPRFQGHPLIVQGRGRFAAGTRRIRADFGVYTTGKQMFFWMVPVMGITQYVYAKTTYCVDDDGYYGLVTARTRNRADSFANYSATMQLPLESELERRQDAFMNVLITFVIEAAL